MGVVADLYLTNGPRSYFTRLRWPYTKSERFERVKAAVKLLPGTHYHKGTWLAANELVPQLVQTFKKENYVVNDKRTEQWTLEEPGQFNRNLHTYQSNAVWAGHSDPDGFLLNDPMGLGKTIEAIEILRLRGFKRILIVCPAIARLTWEKEIAKWWPEAPEVTVIKTQKEAADAVFSDIPGIFVSSYALLHHFSADLRMDAVVYDEIHMLQHPDTRRFTRAAHYGKAVEHFTLGLTGTVFTNKVSSGWGPLSVIYPPIEGVDMKGNPRDLHRFGSAFQYKERYMQASDGYMGRPEFWGVRKDTVDELKMRLGCVSARAAPEEYAGLLPPFSVQTMWMKNPITDAKQWALDAYASGAKFVVLLTHFRDTAASIAQSIKKSKQSKGVPIRVVSGAMAPEARHKVFDEVRAKGQGYICATMHSINTSISLTWADAAAIAEIPPTVAALGQIMGRFHRLDGTPVPLTILGVEGGDKRADALAQRIKALARVVEMGTFESAIKSFSEELRAEGKTDEELKAIAKQAALDWYDFGG